MKRERNFEVLRTVAMFFIVVYHCLTHGVGGEYSFNTSSPVSLINYSFSDLLLVFSSIAVNLYVMISGYFLVDLDFKLSRIIRTWTCTVFYSCLITLLFVVLHVIPFDFVIIGKSFFPLRLMFWTGIAMMTFLSPLFTSLTEISGFDKEMWSKLYSPMFLCVPSEV